MRKFLLALALIIGLLNFAPFAHQPSALAAPANFSCDQGQNNYDDGSRTYVGIRIWGDMCMQYPDLHHWGAIVETRTSVYISMFASSNGSDRCGSGSWVTEFDAQDGFRYANYTEANGVGPMLECDGFGHDYEVVDGHYFSKNNNPYGFAPVHFDP